MIPERPEPDLFILKRLQDHARQLEVLARNNPQLASMGTDLLASSERLGEELEAYRKLQQEWNWFFEHSLDMFAVASLEGYFQRVNSAFERTLGYTRDELMATPLVEFVHPDDVDRTLVELQQLGDGRDSVRFENRYRHHDGRWRWIEWTCPAASANDKRIYAIARDISESKLSAEELLYRAEHDSLTGLGNRALFDQALAKAIARTERNPDNQVALLLIDLDGFKQLNDTHGHSVGDAVLKTVAGRLSTCHREGDVSCRFGGDEFALIVEGSTHVEIDRLVSRLNELLSKPIPVGSLQLAIRASIGVAVYPKQALDATSLLRLADAAMYTNKRNGKASFEAKRAPH